VSDHVTRILNFDDLAGWAEDDLTEALTTYAKGAADKPGWPHPDSAKAKDFFQRHFTPLLIEDGGVPLFTGYFEPELAGSLTPSEDCPHPLYRLPPEDALAALTRREIEQGHGLTGQGLELCWLADPVERFFLHVQGSGRIRLHKGGTLRVGFAGRNGRPYRSIGQHLIALGALSDADLTADAIKEWLRRNPDAAPDVMWANESYVYFKPLPQLDEGDGPIGTLGCPLTALRSVAVDRTIVPLNAPVWLDLPIWNEPRLMIAQDTGSAIIGAQRADIFFGTGEIAGTEAGKMRQTGRMIVLLPNHMAARKLEGHAP